MKTNSPRTVLGFVAVAFVAAVFVSVTGWLLASPADEIKQAVSAQGSSDVKQAKADSFLDAFAAVLVRADKNQAPSYVAAAKTLRPDLAEEITATADEVSSDLEEGDSGDTRRVSRHRRRCTICHNHHTLTLPCKAARQHLEHHPGDTRGPCTPTPAPTAHQ